MRSFTHYSFLVAAASLATLTSVLPVPSLDLSYMASPTVYMVQDIESHPELAGSVAEDDSNFGDFGHLGGVGTTLVNRGILQGIGIGGNGHSNEDSSTSANVIAHGNQQLSGQAVDNSPQMTVGGTNNDLSVSAREPETDGALISRGLLQGIGALGGNGNNNEDSSSNKNVISGGDQLLSGQNIDNSPQSTVGDTDNNFSISARDSATDGVW